MKDFEDNDIHLTVPNLDFFLEDLFATFFKWCDQRNKTLGMKPEQLIKNQMSDYFYFRYKIITLVYSIFDLYINSYVYFNKKKLEKKELNNMSVYAKWKNFPYEIQQFQFKKEDIFFIEKLRLLRNDMSHIKPNLSEITIGRHLHYSISRIAVDLELEGGGKVTLCINQAPNFEIKNALYLINKTISLIKKADENLVNMKNIFLGSCFLKDKRLGGVSSINDIKSINIQGIQPVIWDEKTVVT